MLNARCVDPNPFGYGDGKPHNIDKDYYQHRDK
jgi:hypothetical protein